MDRNSEIIANFESALRKKRTRQLLGLYDKSINSGKSMLNKSCSPSDVLSNLSNQIRAIQKADFVNNGRKTSGPFSQCKTTFTPVNMLPGNYEVLHQTPMSKFETQGVSDTQLLKIMHDVEAIDSGGITQEFNLTFHQETSGNDEEHTTRKNITSPFTIIDISLKEPDIDKSHDIKNLETNHPTIENTHLLKKDNIKLITETNNLSLKTETITNENEQTMNDIKKQELKKEIISEKIECLNDNIEVNTIDSQTKNCTQIFDEFIEIENNDQLDILIKDAEIPLSPILDSKCKQSNIFSPLVFNLDTFESFEQIAVPAVEENPNLETAKQIINSQIIGNELLIHTTKQPLLTRIDLNLLAKGDRISPIIPLSQDELKVEKLDELLEIPKSTSDLKLNILEDEILFSSDEEVESDLKTENLPFTCALKTSFYEKDGVLDKTMYVGFQTASNRSIQICTDSFSKAMDILDFNNALSKDETSLKELVKSCDKNEGTNNKEEETVIRNLKKKMEVDTDVNIFDNVQCQVMPYSAYSKYSNKNKIQNERTNIIRNEVTLLDNSEQKTDVNTDDVFDIVQSQIFPFSKQNNKTKKQTEKLNTQKDIVNFITTDNSTEILTAGAKSIKVFKEQAKTTSDCDFTKSDVSENESTIREAQLKPKCQYEETNVLTNTNEGRQTFKGFQTASNKRINISKNAIEKSIKVFEDIGLKDSTLTYPLDVKLVTISENTDNNPTNNINQNFGCISNYIHTEEENKIEVCLQSITKDNLNGNKEKSFQLDRQQDSLNESSPQMDDKHTIKEFNEHLKLTNIMKINTGTCDLPYVPSPNIDTDGQLCGFKTASNKNIKISHIAVEKSKAVFQDLINKNDSPDVSRIMKKGEEKEKSLHGHVLSTDEETTESHKVNKCINEYSINKEIQSKNFAYTGFETANSKEIIVSKDTLLKTSKIFNDIDNEDLIIPAEIINNFNTYPDLEVNEINDNNKENKSVDLLKLNKTVLKEFENNFYEQPGSDEEAPFYGFESENNEEVRIFEEAMINCGVYEEFEEYPQKTKVNKIDIKDMIHDFGTFKPVFQGFKTASNTEVKISAEALVKSKKILQDIDKPDEENAQENMPLISKFQGFPSSSNKPAKISVKTLAKSKIIFEDIHTDHENKQEFNNENIPTSFQGFQTANNKQVTISAEALAKSKNVFQDINIIDEFKVPTIPETMPSASAFVGFQTASNKSVKISAEALAKTKEIFQDINVVDMENPQIKSNENVSSSSKFYGFRTASNKNVTISEEALTNSRKVFQDIYTKATDTENNAITVQEFKSGDNIEFKISEESLANSKEIFEDKDDSNMENKAMSCGVQKFQTASNKEVKISKDALAKSKRIFQNLGNDQNEDLEGIYSFKGFQTANNKNVKISDEVLARSKRMFDDIVDKNDFGDKGTFKGFETASNKKVKISEEALLKSKKIFQDIKLDAEDVSNIHGIQTEKSNGIIQDIDFKHSRSDDLVDFGFKTANNANIQVSKDALLKSKNLFAYLNTERTSDESLAEENNKNKEEVDIEGIIDTQVINNFEESLHTEDFLKESTPKVSKRSGSPILSCPKAKRRKKFQIPYSQKVVDSNMCKPQCENPEFVEIPKNIIEFSQNYKKNKKYTLTDLQNIEKSDSSIKFEIDNYILKFSFQNLLNFEFFDQRNDISNAKLTTLDIRNIFMDNVNKKLVPEGWFNIHIGLILWKLIAYEIKFPKTMKGITTARNVLEQLKFRYNTELYDAKRPALRKIMEKDDTSCKTLVLSIVAVLVDGKTVTSVPQNFTTLELLLTDGWYCIKANTDRMLSKLASAGRLYAGSKIVTHGAEVTGCEQGVAPWEETSSIRLKLFGNSTRRARWDARLGYHSTAAILTPLSSVMADGGKISKLRLFITRVYPALYVEKFDDGSTVTRSERLEHLHQIKYETERQALMEKLYEEVEREMSDQESPDTENMETDVQNQPLDSGSQIAKAMKRSEDPADFRNYLTSSQTLLLQDHSTRERERLLQQIQTRVQDKMAKLGLQHVRNVVPLLKIRVVGVDLKSNIKVTKAFLSIWKPNDAVLELIKEGIWIEVLNVIPTAIRYSEIQISAGRQSVFNHSQYKEIEKVKIHLQPLKRTCYPIQNLVKNPSMSTEYNEIDTVGFIFLIEPAMKEFDCKKHQFQNVFLADADKNIICVHFWGGLKKFGFENVLDIGQIVCCTNLQKRAGNTRHNILQFRVTEFSYFTKTPKHEIARNTLDDMSKILSGFDKLKFVEDCINLRQNYAAVKLHCNENISPYRMPNIDINSSKNKIFLDSPLHQKINNIDENLNLTGLDFESTFKQIETQELSPKTLIRKQQIKEKIAKLKMYGEPPPLSPMHILNTSRNAGNAFKSPFSKSDISGGVASKQNIQNQLSVAEKGEDTEIQCSPVIINRTYVKRINVNPVKLNFNNAEEETNKSEIIDDFGEEFDGSPPLSLE